MKQKIGFGDFVMSFLNTLMQTTTFLYLWNWFLTPLGVKSITFFHALGIISLIAVPIINLFLYLVAISSNGKQTPTIIIQFLSFIVCAIYLGLGYLYHLLM